MVLKPITLHLPEPLYERVKVTAEATDRSLEEVAEQVLDISFPPLEEDLPSQLRDALAALNTMSDDELWHIARGHLAEDKADRLEMLINARKERVLPDEKGQELEALLAEGDLIMLKKAESYRLLTRRGYTIPWLNH